jgi:tetratricopeptide (TPR) repeat protein
MRTIAGYLACALACVALTACEKKAPPTTEPTPTPPTPSGETAKQPLFDGLGGVHLAITTASEQAQKYFDQGLALAYAFNHAAADLAFTEAQMVDPDCAMCYWGSALVLGPNVNAKMDPGNVPRAFTLVSKAAELGAKATAKEQALIKALQQRYEAEPSADRSHLDRNYAQAMRDIAKAFPDDVDVQTLAAESLMDVHPWDFWIVATGEPQPWTQEIVDLIEGALKLNPEHVGAIHLYIHAVEQSQDANRAAAYADRLASLAPTAGHLVHMPAHIYIRVGRYYDSTINNEAATKADIDFMAACRSDGPIYKAGYVPHNWHFGWITAAIAGWSEKAIEMARGTSTSFPPELMTIPALAVSQNFYVQPLFAYVRFGRWDDILAYPEPDQKLVFARAAWHYAQGRAQLGKGNIDAAQKQLEAVQALVDDPAMTELTFFEINDASTVAEIAEAQLRGEIESAKGDSKTAIETLKEAVALEDQLHYSEPPDWFYPVRHSLGAEQLKAGDAKGAEETFRQDLATFPENGWGLFGLEQALRAQKKTAEADEVAARFEKAWAHSDVELTTTRL